jgi:asparaginyl-tRNA synthetase
LHRQLFGNISGFKHLFIAEILTSPINSQVNFLAWVVSRPRSFGQLVFVDVVDSSGRVQVVVELHRFSRSNNPTAISLLRPESSVYVQGTIIAQGASGLNIEIRAHAIEVISAATAIAIEPPIRGHSQDVLSPQLTDKILSNRHLYLRNPILLSIGKFRSEVLFSMRKWFHSQSFLDISTPIITSSILYEPRSAISITGPVESNKPLFLSQCAGFYLEAAAHAHERVYNLGPSFRNESRTNRHLMEYWHVKAELTSGKLDDIMSLVEIFLRDIRSDCEWFGIQTASLLGNVFPEDFSLPFPRITYVEAQAYLSTRDEAFQFGQNISNHHERMLTEQFCSRGNSPLWITHKPRVLEPFPYAIHPHDTRLTMTADLVAPDGFGEICGVAEKSYRLSDLHERLKEKGMDGRKEYEWVRDMRHYGMVPHVAFGMGLERVIRWWIGAKHVKDTIPFPRLFGRVPLP